MIASFPYLNPVRIISIARMLSALIFAVFAMTDPVGKVFQAEFDDLAALIYLSYAMFAGIVVWNSWIREFRFQNIFIILDIAALMILPIGIEPEIVADLVVTQILLILCILEISLYLGFAFSLKLSIIFNVAIILVSFSRAESLDVFQTLARQFLLTGFISGLILWLCRRGGLSSIARLKTTAINDRIGLFGEIADYAMTVGRARGGAAVCWEDMEEAGVIHRAGNLLQKQNSMGSDHAAMPKKQELANQPSDGLTPITRALDIEHRHVRDLIDRLRAKEMEFEERNLGAAIAEMADRLAVQWNVEIVVGKTPAAIRVGGELAFELKQIIREAIANAVRHGHAKIVLLDIRMPVLDGVSMLEMMRAKNDQRPVIILTAEIRDTELVRLMKDGVNSIVFKHDPDDELREAISAVEQGQRRIPGALMVKAFALAAQNEGETPLDLLTIKERRIADGIAQGRRNRDIGDELGISEGSVKIYLHKVFLKLGITNRTELALLMKTYTVQ